jgi:EmrB/QacA subfamily drug resistance transporter
MTQLVPLFLSQEVSERSQAKRWATVRRMARRPRRVRAAAAGPAGAEQAATEQAGAEQAGAGADDHPSSRPTTAPAPARAAGGRSAIHKPTRQVSALWAIVVTGLALFMASLDNLVVSSALPVIRVRLHAGLSGLEWTVNAYTLTFAVLLLVAAVVGDRFGRRRVFLIGITVFTLSSAMAALAPSIGVLIAARAVQGAGGAMIMPLSLTLLSNAVPPERRNAALGLWGAIGGTAVALGPLVGGAVTTGLAWQYIFWLNVPVGVILVPLAWWKLRESTGERKPLDPAGIGLASIGLFGIVLALVRGNAHGWTSPSVAGSFAVGCLSLAAFVAWELRCSHPMLDLRLFRRRGFTAVNVTALLFSFGMFGAIFFLIQFFQTVQGYSPLAAGIRILPWTAMPMVLAPGIGVLAERKGGKPLVVIGLVLQAIGLAWLISLINPSTPYGDMVAPFVVCGVGMSLFFVPLAGLALGTVPRALEGVASGANSAFRELGGVLGIAVLGAVFSAHGGYQSAHDYVAGMTPAVYVGAGVVAVGAMAALLVPGRRRLGAGRRLVTVDLSQPSDASTSVTVIGPIAEPACSGL